MAESLINSGGDVDERIYVAGAGGVTRSVSSNGGNINVGLVPLAKYPSVFNRGYEADDVKALLEHLREKGVVSEVARVAAMFVLPQMSFTYDKSMGGFAVKTPAAVDKIPGELAEQRVKIGNIGFLNGDEFSLGRDLFSGEGDQDSFGQEVHEASVFGDDDVENWLVLPSRGQDGRVITDGGRLQLDWGNYDEVYGGSNSRVAVERYVLGKRQIVIGLGRMFWHELARVCPELVVETKRRVCFFEGN